MAHDRSFNPRDDDSQPRQRVESSPQARVRSVSSVGHVAAIGRGAAGGAVPFRMPFAAGDTINGKYEVLELIGYGGVGFVVSARHVRLDDRVALKFLRPEYSGHEEAVRRFTIEARANFRIKSDHVVRLLDVDALPGGTPFIVMELLEGIDLGRVIEKQGAVPLELALDCCLQACEALAAAHACQVIHRDVKPENLFLIPSGTDSYLLKMLDFGISKLALSPQRTHGTRRQPCGSPPYMSPEQLRAADDTDVRSDIWSLGCVLYELLTGQSPFVRESIEEILSAVQDATPPPLSTLCPEAPAGLEAVILRCVEKDPEQRFADVAELAAALAPFSRQADAVAERCRCLLSGNTLAAARVSSSAPPATANPNLPLPMRMPMPAASSDSPLPSTSTSTPDSEIELPPLRPRLRHGSLAVIVGALAVLAGMWLRAAPPTAFKSPQPLTRPALAPLAHAQPAPELTPPSPVVILPNAAPTAISAPEPALPAPMQQLAQPEQAPRTKTLRSAKAQRAAPKPNKRGASEIDVGF